METYGNTKNYVITKINFKYYFDKVNRKKIELRDGEKPPVHLTVMYFGIYDMY